MTNSTKTTKIISIFLAAILVAGTITAISPSFIIKGVNAQSESYYEKDTRYSSYEPEPEDRDKDYYSYEPGYPKPLDRKYNNYGSEYQSEYKDKEYNSYEPVYGVDKIFNSYKSQYPPEYKDNNNYGPEYTPKYTDDRKYNSYKPDHYGMDNDYNKKPSGYESNYKQYEKDDRDKSKDSSKSVSINKLNCINNNVNINGNNTGDINLGNSGRLATSQGTDEGYLGVGSSGSYGEGYDNNGYNKEKGESFECIINNNNNNTIVTGNATDGNGNVPDTCEECFRAFLTPVQISAYLQQVNPSSPPTLEQYCNSVGPGSVFDISESAFTTSLAGAADVEFEVIDALIACLKSVGIEFSP